VTDIVTVENDGFDDLTDAKVVAEILERIYPGWLWMVAIHHGGAVYARCGQLTHFGNYGFLIHPNERRSRYRLMRKSIQAGGELLERCGFKRGKWSGEFPMYLEGSDERFRRPIPEHEYNANIGDQRLIVRRQ
jgi:hypothetical protein